MPVEDGKEETARKAAKQEFVISRLLDSPREHVFSVWTAPDHLARWFGPKGATLRTAKMDLRPGGTFHFCMDVNGQVIWCRWVFREITAPEKIIFVNSFSDESGGLTRHPTNPSLPSELLATIEFSEEDNRTRITLRWAPFHATPEEIRAFREEFDVIARSNELLDKLDTYLQ